MSSYPTPSTPQSLPPDKSRIGPPDPLASATIDRVVVPALAEDLGDGDLTSEGLVPAGVRATARLIARAPGVLAGLDVFTRTFELCDSDVQVHSNVADGVCVQPDQELLVMEGSARAILLGERTALNLLQRMSGIATLTARFVEAVSSVQGQGGRTPRILDTRKTTPNLRALEKYAVRCGGGENHRFGLFDEAMIKENHLALAGSDLRQALVDLRGRVGAQVRITAEAVSDVEAEAAVRGGANVILLDNFTPQNLAQLCPRLRDLAAESGTQVELEASGGIHLQSVAAFAASGVDRLSVGALTHSVPALDLSLYVAPVTGQAAGSQS